MNIGNGKVSRFACSLPGSLVKQFSGKEKENWEHRKK